MKSYPFTSQVSYDGQGLPRYDRAVDSEFLRAVFKQYFSDGVFYNPADALQVTADAGMNVQVAPGACHIQGAIAIEDSARVLAVQASGELDRIDTVVARLDLSLAVRSIELYVLKGTPGETPAAPALTRNNTVWELGLADLFIAKNTAGIPQQRITDTRLDTARCGQVIAPAAPADLEPYFAQLEAAIAAHDTAAQAQIAELERVIRGVESGSEVMLKSVYDPQGVEADAMAHCYNATLPAADWAQQADGSYTQTAACAGMTAQVVTLPPYLIPTGDRETDIAAREALGFISVVETLDGQIAVTCWEDRPEVDLTIHLTEVG
ncbi:hypothetical protein [Allofournierella sp.]|uniref:hypothetical protein n=1 Tax=Allofournierella sp. TaxID=1940256 RepID=UPI003AB194A1